MGSTNELDTLQEELVEDDDFFLWEPTQEGVKCSNEIPKILCTVMDAGSALSLSRSKVYQLINSGELNVNGQFLVPADGQQKSQPFTCSLLLF